MAVNRHSVIQIAVTFFWKKRWHALNLSENVFGNFGNILGRVPFWQSQLAQLSSKEEILSSFHEEASTFGNRCSLPEHWNVVKLLSYIVLRIQNVLDATFPVGDQDNRSVMPPWYGWLSYVVGSRFLVLNKMQTCLLHSVSSIFLAMAACMNTGRQSSHMSRVRKSHPHWGTILAPVGSVCATCTARLASRVPLIVQRNPVPNCPFHCCLVQHCHELLCQNRLATVPFQEDLLSKFRQTMKTFGWSSYAFSANV